MDKTAIENMTLDQLKALETELKGQVPSDVVELKRVQDRINFEEQAEEVRKLNQEQEAAQQVRIQAQEEKVDSITLPYDFNDIFDNKKANEMIIELVKEFQRKAYEDHNEEMRARDERELQLKRQNDELQKRLDQCIESENKLQTENGELSLRVNDSDAKRDAAVKQLEEAQAEITQLKSWNDDLRAQAAQGVRKAIDVVDISPTDKLAQMVKETNEQKANRALARWNTIMPEVVAPPVVSAGPAVFPVSDPQANDPSAELVSAENIVVPQESQVEAFRPEEVQTLSAPLDGNTAVPKGDAETVSRDEINIIHARLDRLEKQANLPELQVAV